MQYDDDYYVQLHGTAFMQLIGSLAQQVIICLGLDSDRQMSPNLEAAELTMNWLDVLKEKTEGNLHAEESEFLEAAITETKLRYYEVVRKSDC